MEHSDVVFRRFRRAKAPALRVIAGGRGAPAAHVAPDRAAVGGHIAVVTSAPEPEPLRLIAGGAAQGNRGTSRPRHPSVERAGA